MLPLFAFTDFLPGHFWVGFTAACVFGFLGTGFLLLNYIIFDKIIFRKIDFSKILASNPIALSIIVASYLLGISHIISPVVN